MDVYEVDALPHIVGNDDDVASRGEDLSDELRFAAAGDKVRAAWLLAEAEHYMRIANAQLGLAGDVDVAQTSLGLADDTLRELNEPRLIPVRKLLAGDR